MFSSITTDSCLCGAWRGELGLEPTPELFVQHIVEVFREVRRVMREDATLWLNFGDSYAAGGMGGQSKGSATFGGVADGYKHAIGPSKKAPPGLKPKDLVGVPWRVAFALQTDGWWLRSDIIWSKPNPMPESVRDRPTKSHEYLFLMSKSPRYFFDQEAVRLPFTDSSVQRVMQSSFHEQTGGPKTAAFYKQNPNRSARKSLEHLRKQFDASVNPAGRNLRTVWTIPTQSFSEAHFATFPEDLVEPCLRAGTSEKGCCASCGAPWERIVIAESPEQGGGGTSLQGHSGYFKEDGTPFGRRAEIGKRGPDGKPSGIRGSFNSGGLTLKRETTGWRPTCACQAATQPCLVLDPFCGSGTVGVVALKLNQNFLGIELQPDYIEMAKRRIGGVLPLFAEQRLPKWR